MAGSYPDAPSRRMALDADGSLFLYRDFTNGSAVTQVTAGATLAELNDEDNAQALGISPGGGPTYYYGWLFPELRELDGIYLCVSGGTQGTAALIESSGDTTNSIDGTWTTRIASQSPEQIQPYPDSYRDDIISLAVSNGRMIQSRRLHWNVQAYPKGIVCFHMYGEISAGETPDRLLWIDEITSLEFTLPMDFGDVPRGSARDREMRIKNNSGTLTANTVQITAESLYLNSGSWYTFDVGAGFAATRQIASIGSGATSALITIRQIIGDTETLGLHAARAYASVSSWT